VRSSSASDKNVTEKSVSERPHTRRICRELERPVQAAPLSWYGTLRERRAGSLNSDRGPCSLLHSAKMGRRVSSSENLFQLMYYTYIASLFEPDGVRWWRSD